MLENLQEKNTPVVRTVLGPVPAAELGVVLIHETLLSVVPGAEYAPEIHMDKSEIFDVLKRKLTELPSSLVERPLLTTAVCSMVVT